MPLFENWAGNVRRPFSTLAAPRSLEELAAIVRETAARNGRIRVTGASHSWSDAAAPDNVLVNLDALADLTAVSTEDPAASTVTVQGGMRLEALNRLLDEQGLALPMLGSIDQQSVAGAMSTGTHGSGLPHGNLATGIVSMDVMGPDGAITPFDTSDSEGLAAARVSLGALGIVTALTLKVVPAFRLCETRTPMPFDAVLERLDPLIQTEPYLKIWWLPNTDEALVFTASKTTAPIDVRPIERRVDALINRGPFRALLATGRRFPRLIPPSNRLVRRLYFQQRVRVDVSHRIFNLVMPPRHREAEWAVPLSEAAAGMAALRDIVLERDLRVNFIQEFRFVAGDDAWLSPDHGEARVHIGAYCGEGPDQQPFFDAVEARMLALDGRPHWGKEFACGPDVLAARYPRWNDFLALRDERDPNRVFGSPFTDRIFG